MKLRKKIVTFMVAVEVLASFGSTVEAHEMDGGCTYDVTGAVTYYYGNSLKATHSENF